MQQVFVDASAVSPDGEVRICGTDAHHLGHVLRMHPGERIRICTSDDRYYFAELTAFADDQVTARIIEEADDTELSAEVVLYVGIPKGDRMETIVEKATELGAARVVPVEMKNCVVQLDAKRRASRVARWQTIAEHAARQSKRSRLLQVGPVQPFDEALREASEAGMVLMPYESADGMEATSRALTELPEHGRISIFIGPEGGFSPEEAAAGAACATVISLGKRILRTDTAAITAAAMVMLALEMKNGRLL